jgi:rubrerythrin
MTNYSSKQQFSKSVLPRNATKNYLKTKLVLLALGTAAVTVAVIGRVRAQEQAKLNATTAAHLSTAMHGEAFAYVKYSLYAQHARQSGNVALANLFEQTAKTERLEHFKEEAKVANLIGTDKANLIDSISGESYEYETMYKGFAEEARKAGDTVAAQRFEEIRQDEAKHRDAFKAALALLDKKTAASGH